MRTVAKSRERGKLLVTDTSRDTVKPWGLLEKTAHVDDDLNAPRRLIVDLYRARAIGRELDDRIAGSGLVAKETDAAKKRS
jgi:hypothetical protein